MNQQKMIDVLRYWHIEDCLLPQSLDTPDKLKSKFQQSFTGDLQTIIQGTKMIANENRTKTKKNEYVWEFSVFGGIYEIENIKKTLLDTFGTKDDFEGRKETGQAATYVLTFNSELEFKVDGVQISTAPWAIQDIVKNKKLTHLDYMNFQLLHDKLKKAFNEDASLEDYDFGSFIEQADVLIKDHLGRNLLKEDDYYQVIAIKRMRKNTDNSQSDIDMLNSFYLEDLDRTLRYIKSNQKNKLLDQYLEMELTDNRIDIREDISYVYSMLQPNKLPNSCWATDGGYPLVYGQQFAINSIKHRFLGNGGIYAVNGPPGTGKTTMLRDLIASIISERAEEISKLKSPDDMFGIKKSIWKIDKYQRYYYPIEKQFLGYEMVVASSNNGAVENVTKEIPAEDSIDQNWKDQIDFFKEVGSAIIGDKAWGTGAAPLGNSTNKSKFVSNFWYPDMTKDKYDGFNAYLKKVEKIPKSQRVETWKKAKASFKKALNEVSNFKQEKMKIIREVSESAEEVDGIESDIKKLMDILSALQNHIPTFWEHLLEMLLPFKKTRQDKIEEYELEISKAKNNLKDAQKHYQLLFDEYKRLIDYSDIDAEREKSSPWTSDEAFQKARTKVFVEALNLHKAQIDACAEKVHTNLLSMMDVLSNKVNKNTQFTEAVQNLWATLFLTVPVVSTTFASFSRLFSHLWDSKIGWLLIDEAGQASAKAAVGAIMRSKRAVIVGDPLQLEPIVGLPGSIQNILHKEIGAHKDALSDYTSVQKRADFTESHGTYLESDTGEDIWVGSPLRVHRRCHSPMFEISNETTYQGLMVQGKGEDKCHLPQSAWIDVSSTTNTRHWIEEEGQKAEELVRDLIYSGVSSDDIYLISPFRDVVKELKNLFRKNNLVDSNNKVGTIHTVQGKEAKVVILVLGSDPKSNGARAWAASKPNLLNVAATRAKDRLYIIGNKSLWESQNYFQDAVRLLDS